ncbi:hypothetical protein [Rhodopseudomonas sp. P2A-2r]|uniref:hypothetical protein n=1 Tax=unclassified Rhodopseudomonas TaxID=2638247 RepID=UPI002233EB4E|nr:hypothetical protein [Rhodopseudomonas sp. P2A-2r]UZE47277.1 hypothetical protein ONR75_20210 [Rhodopseudomonas sp. P2A-2r]
MPTDQQISIMCDVARSGEADVPREHLAELLALISEDYVEESDCFADQYQLTSKGQALLDERGVGVNEA